MISAGDPETLHKLIKTQALLISGLYSFGLCVYSSAYVKSVNSQNCARVASEG